LEVSPRADGITLTALNNGVFVPAPHSFLLLMTATLASVAPRRRLKPAMTFHQFPPRSRKLPVAGQIGKLLRTGISQVAILAGTIAASSSDSQAASFAGLGGNTRVESVSADGSAVVGYASTPTFEAVRWQNGIMTELGFLPSVPGGKRRWLGDCGHVHRSS
jgi:hypothetical protein